MASTFLFLIDEFTYLVNQVKFHLPYVEEVVKPIIDKFSVVQSSLKYAEDALEQQLLKELEGIVRNTKAAIENHAFSLSAPGQWRRRRRRRRMMILFKRCPFRKRVETWFKKSAINLKSEIHELGDKLANLLSSHSFNAAGESSQRNQNKVAAGEGLSSHPQGKQVSDWIRSSADYDEKEEEEEEEDVIIGLKHDIEFLKTRLLDIKENQLLVISVFGIQGIGKTVLAWEVYKSSDVDNHFDCKAWVCISSVGNDIEEILKDIVKKVIILQEDPEITEDGQVGFQNKLTEFLREKRYLIVIDDVPCTKVWNDLKEAFPNGQNGSRIILTTRNVEVAYLANSDGSPHRLWVLSAADSWELFIRKVFGAPSEVSSTDTSSSATTITTTTSDAMKYLRIPPHLEVIGRKMVKKCKGIPLLIVALADLVSTRSVNASEWSSVLHCADILLKGDDAHLWFNLSGFLDKMISSHVKQRLPCLLELFPNEIEIPTRRFILSWAAEGLFFGQHYGELADEEVADDCLQQLLHFDVIRTVKVSSNGNAKTCSIPCDLPKHRVLSTNIARNSSHDDHRCVWFHYPEQSHSHQPPENPEHAAHSDEHPDHDHGNANFCKTLFSLWCFNFPGGYEAGQKVGLFLGRCISEGGLKFLGVLDLEGVFRPCLPEEIGELINLRYLGLRETYLETLPSNVGKLVNLQTLDTKHTYVRNYHRFIQKLKKLRHLHLNEGPYSTELVSRLSHLGDLRTLSGIVVEEFDLFYGLHRLTKLRKLRFTCQLNPQRKAGTIKWLEELEQLRSLKVRAKDYKNQLATIGDLEFVTKNKELNNLYLLGRLEVNFDPSKFPKNLTTLTLSGSELDEDPMPKLEKLPKLQFLRLLSKSFKGQKMVCSSRGFVQLRVLRIWKLEELQELTVEEGAMQNIEELEIRYCKNLKKLSSVPETLSEFKLTKMQEEFTKKFVNHKAVNIVK
ncbi:disease resistance protein RPP13-like [Macadamia integrifolia]|uniref:disease resistance protein RPP13-like n=1 Tax=Macadamia integrifolia TaxID=60698 RepID=UPI001C4F61AC|nr:disease resistance protein RPP13-like [Macadamia integrifolia]